MRRSKTLQHKIKLLEKKLHNKKCLYTDNPQSAAQNIEDYKSYLSYKFNFFKSTNVWSTAGKIFSYSRRSLFVARIFKYAASVIAFIESSAVFLITGAVLLLLIPVSLLSAAILAVINTFNGRKYNRFILPKLKDKKILFLVAKKGFDISRGSYFHNMVYDFTSNADNFVFVVSKSLKNGFFLTAKLQKDNLIVIREPYFFKLLKHLRQNRSDYNRITIVH